MTHPYSRLRFGPSAGCLIVLFALSSNVCCGDQWPQWRGESGDNHAAADAKVPLRWDFQSGSNIHWKLKIPGRGHSTPIVTDDGIFMTTADSQKETQSLIKVDRETGLVVDQWVVHRNTLPAAIHGNNSYASPSPAFDGERVIVSFHTDDAIWLTAMTTEGREAWKVKVCDFKPSLFQFGYGASPIIEDGLVIVAAEYDGAQSGLYAHDSRTGKQVWKTARPKNLNFASPIVYSIAGQRQILLAGAGMMTGYDVATGRRLWKVDTTTEAICGTVVRDGRRVIVSGGNPKSGTWCVLADGSQKQLWENNVKCYEQSLLTIDNYVFAFSDSGVAYCFRTADGKQMWKERLFGGGISSSPYLVGDRIYVGSEKGTVYVIKASPDRFELLAENPTGESLFATPVVVDDRMYLRTATGSGSKRQEYLIAIEAK
ncbi:PQQ-binding-like beta-propeller repeat protein [Stieleria marina]|uniref:Outer membrane biogenesis protein BamB n=1 Tax=Stieleria marina TaxID=1930275 RepID=A0A517NU57_9BACT|nr:outer membrane biogenesis protein BamB [Planctomycetes bacterium K23_9]